MHDIPLQYGLGPTLTLAQACKATGCWEAFYWMVGLSNYLMVGLLAYLALQFNDSKHPLSVLATLLIVLVCSMFWTAYPPELWSTLAAPSTSGMRFLPGVLMLSFLVRHIQRLHVGLTSTATPVTGHLMWLVCVIWSPEAGVHGTLLWGSYFVSARRQEGPTNAIAFARAALHLAAVLMAGVAIFAAVYHGVLGTWPLVSEYLVYLLHPPGALPINPFGTVWFAILCLFWWWLAHGLSGHDLHRHPMSRMAWLVALLCLGVFSYYLGRSHDNNVLNLLPFFALLLQATRALTKSNARALNVLASTMLASLLGWTVVFGGANYKRTHEQGQLLYFAPEELAKAFTRESPRSRFHLKELARHNQLAPGDVEKALTHIHATYREPVEIFDALMLVDSGEPFPPWSALHGPENFVFIPSKLRETYVRRIAHRFGQPGWVLHPKGDPIMVSYLKEYDAGYLRSTELDFDGYKAIRFLPR